MLLARLAESKRPHLGHSAHLCVYTSIPHPYGQRVWDEQPRVWSTVCLGCHQWVTLLLFLLYLMSCLWVGVHPSWPHPSPVPLRQPCSQLYTFPGPHDACHLIYLTLSPKSQVTMTISIRRDSPALSVGTVHSLPWTVVFLARPWPRLGLDTDDQILHVWALVLFVLNLLVGIINTTEPTSE